MLPTECLRDVFAFLNTRQLINIELVNRRCRTICMRHLPVILRKVEFFFSADRCQIIVTSEMTMNHNRREKRELRIGIRELHHLLTRRQFHILCLDFIVCPSNCAKFFEQSETDENGTELLVLIEALMLNLDKSTKLSIIIARASVRETDAYSHSVETCFKLCSIKNNDPHEVHIGIVYMEEAATSAGFDILTQSKSFRHLNKICSVIIEIESDEMSEQFLDDINTMLIGENNALKSLDLRIFGKFPATFSDFLQNLQKDFRSASFARPYTLKWCYRNPGENILNTLDKNANTSEYFRMEYHAHGCQVMRGPTKNFSNLSTLYKIGRYLPFQ